MNFNQYHIFACQTYLIIQQNPLQNYSEMVTIGSLHIFISVQQYFKYFENLKP